MYDYIIITHIPAFYKVNLYNELAKKLNILVVFIASNTAEKRADDFITLKNAKFEYKVLFDGNFQDRNVKVSIQNLKNIFKKSKYKKILVSGWDLKEFWYTVFSNRKSKNCLALESIINESKTTGPQGLIKKLFLSRISTVFASGNLHKELLNALGYKGLTKITKGVGIINKPGFDKVEKAYAKKFLYIGRLSEIKNLEMLIKVFNSLADDGYSLTIIGTGDQAEYLQQISNSNITFMGSVENKFLKDIFLSHNIFILPSKQEPWGLVVEEALYFNTPVVISKNCGACEIITQGENGYLIDSDNIENIKKTILSIDSDKYNKLKQGTQNFSIELKDKEQLEVYI